MGILSSRVLFIKEINIRYSTTSDIFYSTVCSGREGCSDCKQISNNAPQNIVFHDTNIDIMILFNYKINIIIKCEKVPFS